MGCLRSAPIHGRVDGFGNHALVLFPQGRLRALAQTELRGGGEIQSELADEYVGWEEGGDGVWAY